MARQAVPPVDRVPHGPQLLGLLLPETRGVAGVPYKFQASLCNYIEPTIRCYFEVVVSNTSGSMWGHHPYAWACLPSRKEPCAPQRGEGDAALRALWPARPGHCSETVWNTSETGWVVRWWVQTVGSMWTDSSGDGTRRMPDGSPRRRRNGFEGVGLKFLLYYSVSALKMLCLPVISGVCVCGYAYLSEYGKVVCGRCPTMWRRMCVRVVRGNCLCRCERVCIVLMLCSQVGSAEAWCWIAARSWT